MSTTAGSTGSSQRVSQCRVCGHTDSHQTFQIREMMFGTREEFEYFMCRACGCLQIANIPKDISRHYPEGYYSHQTAPSRPQRSLFRRVLERLLINTALFDRGYKLSSGAKQFASLPDTFFRTRPELLRRAGVRDFRAAILDIGCGGQAQWLRDLRSIGFRNLMGIDPFIDADCRVQGVPILRCDTSALANRSRGAFDLITLHHSLEHIPDQLGTLRDIQALLAPTGTCVIRIPTISSLAWDMYGMNWVELDAPRHLYLHSKESLRESARKVGLDLFDIQYDTTAFEFYGSEQYKLGVSLTAPDSLWVNPASTLFSHDMQEEFEALARTVNANGTAGRACFFFRHTH